MDMINKINNIYKIYKIYKIRSTKPEQFQGLMLFESC